MRRSRVLLFSLVLFVLVAGPIEYTCLVVGRFLAAKGVFYSPQDTSRYDEYMAARDPVLGWTREYALASEVDASGSRRIPAFPEPGHACASLYGDSMTWSSEVDPAHSWANVLSLLLHCRVANYGVGGYGTDQALLRFEHNRGDEARVVVLAHLGENIVRNVNQYRRLLYPGNEFGLKPRFILDDHGELVLIPIPTFTKDEFARLTLDPDPFFAYEYYRLADPVRVRRLHFPYSLSILSAFGDYRVRAGLARRPSHFEFYRPDHDSGGLALTTAILARFDSVARERGRLPLVVIIPTGGDFEYFGRTGDWAFEPLVSALAERRIEAFNVGPALIAALPKGRDPCELILIECSGHFTEEGYAVLARTVATELQRRGYVTPAAIARRRDAGSSRDLRSSDRRRPGSAGSRSAESSGSDP